ncbi:MAG TPA: hypothetical protein VEA99_15845 [Gemmatimonadaceae bacterium]|nr:hypothetical protein [Gemmatimonadaceae bacterium]
MRVVNLLRRSTVAAGLVAGALACSDANTGPTGVAAVEPVTQGTVAVQGVGNEFEGSASISINPYYSYDIYAGDHRITLPALTICDPLRTGYGKAEWDKPCYPATRRINLTVHYKLSKDTPEIRFSPDVRFVPSQNPARWVMLSMKVRGQMRPMDNYNILWFDAGEWVDESLGDPTLKAHEDRIGHRVTRRLKHFSGYSVTAGRRDTGEGEGEAGASGETGY